MCLEFKKLDKRVAEKNIIVAKEGGVINGRFKPKYTVTNFEYIRGTVTPKVEVKPILFSTCGKINEGYHSWISLWNGTHLFIIPKGTTYYVGGFNTIKYENNYVSEQIIWIGSKWNPITWLKIFLLNRKTK